MMPLDSDFSAEVMIIFFLFVICVGSVV